MHPAFLLCSIQLKKELDAFDPAFFEEIEDLKYNYQEAVKKNIQYEEQLVALAKQFGVSVPCLELWVWDLYWICYQIYWPILKTSLGEILSATCVVQNSIQKLHVGVLVPSTFTYKCVGTVKKKLSKKKNKKKQNKTNKKKTKQKKKHKKPKQKKN